MNLNTHATNGRSHIAISKSKAHHNMSTFHSQTKPLHFDHQEPSTTRFSRKNLLIGISLLSIATTPYTATAEESTTLPKSYEKTARSLIDALRDSIDADINGAPEREVRRKADPAKDSVRQFLTRWKDAPIIRDDDSYIQIIAAIQQLGDFYLKNGQRARLDKNTADSLLLKLDRAEIALPPVPEKKSLLPFEF